ncbi:MAG: D-alanyl-D-alanine carboxypeptidase family protein [Bacilli bacterium]
MKKIIITFLIAFLFIPLSVNANEIDITKGASSAVMIDYDTGEILYNKNANSKKSVASLTKMMGLLLIFEKIDDGSIKINEQLTVSKNAKEMGGTQIWLEEGEKISVDDLLKGITMASANDAMVLMAERVSGTEEAFVKQMNEKAKKLGLKNTNFVNSTGFDEEGGYSSSYDMAIIAKELIKHKKILDYTSKYEDYIRENTENKTWIVNTNKLVKFYKGVDGLKTGYTDEAGSSIAVTAEKNGLRLIVISLGYDNTTTRNSETMALLDYGYNQYESKSIFQKGQKIKEVKLAKANKNKVNLVLSENLKVTEKKGEKEKHYTYDIKLDNINYPIKKGEKIGKLYLKDGNKIIREIDLLSDSNIKKASIFKQYLRVVENYFSGCI